MRFVFQSFQIFYIDRERLLKKIYCSWYLQLFTFYICSCRILLYKIWQITTNTYFLLCLSRRTMKKSFILQIFYNENKYLMSLASYDLHKILKIICKFSYFSFKLSIFVLIIYVGIDDTVSSYPSREWYSSYW